MTPIPPQDRPHGTTLGYKYTGLVVEPDRLLPWLVKQLTSMGCTLIKRTVSSLDEAKTLARADLVVNATGLGAADLAHDSQVESVRGQTMAVRCTDWDRVVIRQGSEYTYAIPRRSAGVVILGGVSQAGSTQAQPDMDTRRDILDRINRMTNGAFEWVDLDRDVARDIVGFRPGRQGGIRLERRGDVIHAYGLKGLGYLYAFGVAQRVVELAGETPSKL